MTLPHAYPSLEFDLNIFLNRDSREQVLLRKSKLLCIDGKKKHRSVFKRFNISMVL